MPSPTDLNFDDISEFIPHTFNIDLSTGTEDPTFRFVGKDLARDCGGDFANRRLSELQPLSLLAQTVRHLGEIVAHGEPVVVSDRFVAAWNREVLFRAIMLPFSRTGDRTDYIIGAVNCKSVPIDAAEQRARQGMPAAAKGVGSAPPSADPQGTTQLHDPEPCAPAPPERRGISDLVAVVEKAVASAEPAAMPQEKALRAEHGEGAAKKVGAAPGQTIVVGSGRGETGKSTTAMHLIVSLLYEGHKVGTIDLDCPQQMLSRYIENRRALCNHRGLSLPMPEHVAVPDPAFDAAGLEIALGNLLGRCDHVVIDTPGSDTALSRRAHAWADKVITPINDSFLDLDSIAAVDADTGEVVTRGHYAEIVMQARKQKADMAGGTFDWIVIRNRLSHPNARNKQKMTDTLEMLATSLDFRNESGLGERVIYRELFPLGLTLLDLRRHDAGIALTMSHIAARQELRTLLKRVHLHSKAVSTCTPRRAQSVFGPIRRPRLGPEFQSQSWAHAVTMERLNVRF